MTGITSRRHPIVDAFRELVSAPDPSGRRLVLDGVHLIRDAHNAGLEFELLIVDGQLPPSHEAALLASTLRADGVEVFRATTDALSAISPVRTPSGVVAVARRTPVSLASLAGRPAALILVAVDVQDPGNVGAIVRSVEAAGWTGAIVCGNSANPFGWKALRGSMGSTLRFPVATTQTVEEALSPLKSAGIRMLASAPDGGVDPDDVDWSRPTAVLLGGEGGGLTPSTLRACEARLTIPMSPGVESLNVAVAAALVAYAARRQRHRAGAA